MDHTLGQAPNMTPTFVNSILDSFLGRDQVTVIDVKQEPLTGSNRYNALMLRLHLTYDREPHMAPQTLIAKLPMGKLDLHGSAEVFQPGARENWFYRVGARRSPVAVPRSYYHDVDSTTGQSILILEDLAPAVYADQLRGTTLTQARLALDSLARLHAAWWADEASAEIQELKAFDTEDAVGEMLLVQQLYDTAWPRFREQALVQIPLEVVRFGDSIVGDMKAVDALSDHEPRTLVHGDYRLGNMFFDSRRRGRTCWIFDWEDVYFGSPMIDATWFLGGCLPVENTHHEIPLLRHYYRALIGQGVEDYAWERCHADYRRAMCSSFVQGVLSATLDSNAGVHERELARTIARRFVAGAQRLGLQNLLGEFR